MFYIFDKNGNCVGSCDFAPDTGDLATRGERVIESALPLSFTSICLVGEEIKEKPQEEAPEGAPVDEERLAAFEAMAAQEEVKENEEMAIHDSRLRLSRTSRNVGNLRGGQEGSAEGCPRGLP